MKPGFQTPYIKFLTEDGRNGTVIEKVIFCRRNGEVIEIHEGANTDGASTPQIMWNVIPPFGIYWKSAVLHDYLYRYTTKPKDYCDEVFLEAMELEGVDEHEAHTIYQGVHLFGWKAFRDDRKGL